MKKVIFALLFLAAYPVWAIDATLKWAPPTQYEDNAPILAGTVLTYNIYGGDCTGPRPMPKLTPTPIATTSSLRTNISPGKAHCYAVTAIAGGLESAMSMEVSYTVAPSKPVAPATISIK